MGLLEFLRNLFTGGKTQCPSCGAQGARKASDGRIACRNPMCPYFEPTLVRAGLRGTAIPTKGKYRPEHPITIRYGNFRGEERTFSTERESTVRKGNHLVVQVAPTGRKIALSRDRILNLSEVESALPQRVAPGQAWPTPRERQILGYHKKYRTTSPRFEEVRRKYPNW
jgi:hypothetical protein